jgi:hypothetical protein
LAKDVATVIFAHAKKVAEAAKREEMELAA